MAEQPSHRNRKNAPDDFSSSTRWHHQESSKFAKHAGVYAAPRQVRGAEESSSSTKDLTDFLNKTRIDDSERPRTAGGRYQPIVVEKFGDGHPRRNGETLVAVGSPAKVDAGVGTQHEGSIEQDDGPVEQTDGREVRCGPLLNYRRMENGVWHGSVLLVVKGGIIEEEFTPVLLLQKAANRNARGEIIHDQNFVAESQKYTKIVGVRLYSDPRNIFWRFNLAVPMDELEMQMAYRIPGLRFVLDGKRDRQQFYVPSINESMRIMFYSCNGFSVGTDEAAWSGPALWNDVQRVHRKTPFHVMIGGGDQIYNDGIRVHGPLREWTAIGNPKRRRDYPFPEKLRKACDNYYVSNYIRWYSTEPFAGVNGQIPQLNLWDDHDIIDGFGSYVDHFMMCNVFRGIGGTAYKYYMLFQHHLPPPLSTYTTDAPQTMKNDGNGVGADPAQLKDTYVLQNEPEDSSYIIGHSPGPYVQEHSRSVYARLGARIAFFGLDARTERTRHQVNYPDTYQLIHDRLQKELAAAAATPNRIQHLVVLLGIPIAYPRLTWLENILSSPLMGPIKFLNKRFGVAGGFINHFDGGVDLVDDLDDHYTARQHKRERHELVKLLQDLSEEFSVRVTILSGDVHLAAVGRFYSNPKFKIPAEEDPRYMVNVVSSAIVNKPPPSAVANLLARRNKIHHLDEYTDETLLTMFDKDPGATTKTASSNKVTMPSRNWAMLTECSPLARQDNSQVDGSCCSTNNAYTEIPADNGAFGKDGHSPLGPGEVAAGTTNRAASTNHGRAGDGSLDVSIRVEKDQHDATGQTLNYGMWIPQLKTGNEIPRVPRVRDIASIFETHRQDALRERLSEEMKRKSADRAGR